MAEVSRIVEMGCREMGGATVEYQLGGGVMETLLGKVGM